ncbi:hypothetical protein [Gramella sp. MAR_2010_147]|uniref:hypothetical protein n=1 Tax=Gramella sp. MAR_2010_147 TaxID=1250205 RepID=UPI0008796A63|nr:hypothetical protein [Gramella sp. MAR_2010_147]SDS22518.1 hypothetical protein SAMN04488553_1765 [Gramella sp. MAR_2010_147]
MRIIIFILIGLISVFSYSQKTSEISTIDFVEVLNDHKEEALFYYQKNWKELRESAVKEGYISSFEMLETSPGLEYPISFILITTYAGKEQYDLREKHFAELIKAKGSLDLLNEKKPDEFRKTLFSKENVVRIK